MLKDGVPQITEFYSFFFLIHFTWMLVLFQEQVYMMGIYALFDGMCLLPPKPANLLRLQREAVRPLSSCPCQPHLRWIESGELSCVPQTHVASKKWESSPGRVMSLATKWREMHNWVVLCCKCDFPYVSDLSVSPLRSGYFKIRIDSQKLSDSPRVSRVYLQLMQDGTGDKRNVLTLDDDIMSFILM